MSRVRKAVLPVAGLGTRFLPWTKAVAKEMLPVVDRPVVQVLVEDCVSAGIEEIIFVVSPNKSTVQKYFQPDQDLTQALQEKGRVEPLRQLQDLQRAAKFHFVRQDQPLGDGHAILQAKDLLQGESFVVMFGDELIFNNSGNNAVAQLLQAFEKLSTAVVGLQEVAPSEVDRFGIVQPGEALGEDCLAIANFQEKPKVQQAFSNLAIVGKYLCPPEIFLALEQCGRSPDGELRLIDGLLHLQKSQSICGKVLQGQRFDTGSKLGFLQANLHAGLRHSELGRDFLDFVKGELSRLENQK